MIAESRFQLVNLRIEPLPSRLQLRAFRLQCGQVVSRFSGFRRFKKLFFSFEFAAPRAVQRLFVRAKRFPTGDAQV
jgi:hypothetical protein